MAAMFFSGSDKISNLYRTPSIYVSYQVSVHLAKQFQRRFLEIDHSETSVTEVQCTLQRGELAVCTNNGTSGQSIARLKLP